MPQQLKARLVRMYIKLDSNLGVSVVLISQQCHSMVTYLESRGLENQFVLFSRYKVTLPIFGYVNI